MHGKLLKTREAVDALNARFGGLEPAPLIAALAHRVFAGRIAALSSFGADSVVLLHHIAQAAPALPVLFLQTGKHFSDTLVYRHELAEEFGLTGVIDLKPAPADLKAEDPAGRLHETSAEQ